MPRPERVRVQSVQSPISKVEQFHKNDVDINTIVARAKKGHLVPGRSAPGFYGDFTGVEDYHTNLERIRKADESFMTLPAKIRKEFDNDPGKLLAFLSDESNREKAIELGILEKPAPVTVEPEPPAEPV